MSPHAPPLPTGTMPPPPTRPGGWRRQWKRAVQVLVAFFGLLFLGVIALFAYGVFSMLGSSDVAMQAKHRAQQDPRVIEALGQPVEPGWLIQGKLQHDGPSGTASLQIPLDGPKADGDLHIEAVKRVGRWQYRTLTVVVDSKSTDIDLRTPEEIAAASATDEGDFSSSDSVEAP